jgi:hypothetical protein
MSIPKIYTDETAARRHLEKLQCPDAPYCGGGDQATKLKGNPHNGTKRARLRPLVINRFGERPN